MANPWRSAPSASARARIRFQPPKVEADSTLRWVLLRAFAPPGIAPAGEPLRGALALARRLGLASRIASRQDAALLVAEVGEEDARGFQRRRAATVANQLRSAATAEEVARRAEADGISLVLLKGFALEVSGRVTPGSRPAADLDLLVPEARLATLQATLAVAGFNASPTPAMEHQLPPLVAPAGGVVELHRCLLGVRLAGSARSVTYDLLLKAGQLEPAPGWPGHFVPSRAVLLAHAAVHGLVQHGYSPDAYVALRLVADWIDLSAPDSSATELETVTALVAGVLSVAEIQGLRELVERLAAGDLRLLAENPASSPAAGLLHHLLAGTLNEAYASALKLEMLVHPLSDSSYPVARLKALKNALLPTAEELEVLYGGWGGPWGRLGRRLWRPLDLALRTLRHAGRVLAGARLWRV